MNWLRVGFALSDLLSILLIIKLVVLRLHSVYRVFCAFLFFQVLSESVAFIEKFTPLDNFMDYRITWLIMRLGSWTLSLWVVYALLRDILANLPGILSFARKVLLFIIPFAVVVALVTAQFEYSASGAAHLAFNLDYLVSVALIFERLVTTIALLVLLLMLAFILWFPVTMPRNLVIFSIGLSIYFSAKASLILFHNFVGKERFPVMDGGVTLILCICLAYWITFLNRAGQYAPVIVGHRWHSDKQSELLHNLEHINAALARAGRR
jgi:hypothetical protein